MDINRDKNGVLYWSDYIDGKRVKKQNKKWKTKREAKAHYDDYILKYNNDEIISSRIKLDELTDKYVLFCSISMKPSTISSKRHRMSIIINNFVGNVYVDSITTNTLQQFQMDLLEDTYTSNGKDVPLSNSYINTLQTELKGILDYAVNFDYLIKNPFNKVPYIKRHTYQEEKEMVILTKQQFDSFMDVIEDQTFRAIFSALYWCGMRIGELLALNIRDYNKEDKTINIYKNYDFRNRVMTTTKTGATRIISVPDICCIEIDKLLEQYKKSEGSKYSVNNYLFGYFEPISKTSLNREKSRYIDLANTDEDDNPIDTIPYFTYHELRHTHVSTLINLDMKPKDIAVRLGHSVEMVNNTYSHLFPERKDVLIDRLNDLARE